MECNQSKMLFLDTNIVARPMAKKTFSQQIFVLEKKAITSILAKFRVILKVTPKISTLE